MKRFMIPRIAHCCSGSCMKSGVRQKLPKSILSDFKQCQYTLVCFYDINRLETVSETLELILNN